LRDSDPQKQIRQKREPRAKLVHLSWLCLYGRVFTQSAGEPLFDVISGLPFSSLYDGKGFAGWFKSFLFEKALCDKRHTIIKKLRHSVITFTDS
jgi:hypothetical protein